MNYGRSEHEFLCQCLNNNMAAVALCECLGAITQVWDDLIDRDVEVSYKSINETFWLLLFDLPQNPFYQENQKSILPVIQMAVIDWFTANKLERGNSNDKVLAFVLRDSLTSVVISCARIIGGYDWVVRWSPVIRQFFHDESLSDYVKDLPGCQKVGGV